MDVSRLPPFVRAMLRPEFYPHPIEAPVLLVQTHISFVLLTGPFAYKVKKAVDLGFLDFSTLDRRLHFCQEELRLNARGAPGLYLDVLPIIETSAGQFELTGGGEAGEYAPPVRQIPPATPLRNPMEHRAPRNDGPARPARGGAA